MPIDFANIGQRALEPSPRPSGRYTGRHFVQFYEDHSSLVGAVGTFLTLGLASGDAGIVIADSDHRHAIEQSLALSGLDITAAQQQGYFMTLDAGEALADFMVEGLPDAAKFAGLIGATIEAAGQGGRTVRIFGEMVAVLWQQGNILGAIKLEEQWNELARTHQFHLFCAYPTDSFDSADLDDLGEVCHQHTQVIPPAMWTFNNNQAGK